MRRFLIAPVAAVFVLALAGQATAQDLPYGFD
jgi:hypothetical protein